VPFATTVLAVLLVFSAGGLQFASAAGMLSSILKRKISMLAMKPLIATNQTYSKAPVRTILIARVANIPTFSLGHSSNSRPTQYDPTES
jgi:hypothetical protein